MSTRGACYGCRYRGDVPGSAHSACRHPAVLAAPPAGPLADLLAIMSPGVLPPRRIPGIEVAGHPVGIASGWFAWPANFDPVWLVSCTGTTPPEGTPAST